MKKDPSTRIQKYVKNMKGNISSVTVTGSVGRDIGYMQDLIGNTVEWKKTKSLKWESPWFEIKDEESQVLILGIWEHRGPKERKQKSPKDCVSLVIYRKEGIKELIMGKSMWLTIIPLSEGNH